MDTMDKANVQKLGKEVEEAMRAIAERHGLTYKPKGGSYDPGVGTFTPRGEFSLADSGAKEWERWASLYGLAAEDFGRTFRSNGKAFTISGFAPKSKKYPVLATCGDQTYKFTPEHVRMLLAAS